MASQSPMYRAFVEVVPEAAGFTGALSGQVAASAGAAGIAGGKAAAGGVVSGIGKALPLIGAGIAALGLGDIIGNAISDGANYEQAVGAVEDVFEGAAKEIVKFSKSSAKTFGLSATQALTGAKNFGIFGRAAGLTGSELAEFSTNLLGLGADLAAFGNTTPEEAVVALGAGLRGESEPLRQYGVLLDDAKLRARALEMGIYDGNGALTSQQKILAAQAEIFAQTGIQQGQFARESDTLAAKQAILAAAWADVSAQLGTAFLPLAQEAVEFITNDMIPALEDFSAWLNEPDTQQGLKTFGEAVRETGNFLRDWFVAPLNAALSGISGFAAILNNDITFDQFQERMVALPGFFGELYGAAATFGEGIQRTVAQIFLRIQDFSVKTGRAIGDVVEYFLSLPRRIAQAVTGVGTWLYESGRAVIRGFLDGIGSMFQPINDVMGGVMDFIAGFFPHSPAERGAFAGSGWTDLERSGAAMFSKLGEGMEAQARSLAKSNALMADGTGDAGSGGRVVVQQTIQPAPGMSEEQIARIAADKTAFALRRN